MRASTALEIFAQSTPKFRKATVATYEFGTLFNIEDQLIHLCKALKTRARALVKFTRSDTCFKTIFKYSGKALLASTCR